VKDTDLTAAEGDPTERADVRIVREPALRVPGRWVTRITCPHVTSGPALPSSG
jgi:hypothetical protein